MQAKLTNQTIRALRPAEKPYEVVDVDLKGFLLRIQPSGVMTYYFTYRNEQGKRARCARPCAIIVSASGRCTGKCRNY